MCLVVSGIEVRYHIMKLYIYIHKYYHESFSNMLKKYKAGYIFFLNYLQIKYRWVGVMFKWHFGFLKISKFLSDMQFFQLGASVFQLLNSLTWCPPKSQCNLSRKIVFQKVQSSRRLDCTVTSASHLKILEWCKCNVRVYGSIQVLKDVGI